MENKKLPCPTLPYPALPYTTRYLLTTFSGPIARAKKEKKAKILLLTSSGRSKKGSCFVLRSSIVPACVVCFVFLKVPHFSFVGNYTLIDRILNRFEIPVREKPTAPLKQTKKQKKTKQCTFFLRLAGACIYLKNNITSKSKE